MNTTSPTNHKKSGPLVAASTLIGFGMGGFIDGILLHQILQWHQMISAILPPIDYLSKSINMFWDGIFHAFTWIFTAIGIGMLWKVLNKPDTLRSTPVLWGGLILGWGIFNLMDSIVNHYLFNFHNIKESMENPQVSNHIFLGITIVQLLIGWLIIIKFKNM